MFYSRFSFPYLKNYFHRKNKNQYVFYVENILSEGKKKNQVGSAVMSIFGLNPSLCRL